MNRQGTPGSRGASSESTPRKKLSCESIARRSPPSSVESELFGHEKGAFTGAIAQRIGRLELANQGTLFLDEVGDIPLDIQAKLLRSLQEKEFERLGSSRTLTSDARIVAATNRDLKKMVKAGEFRRDLYYRLNVFPISVPPLRERREDIPLLAQYFLSKHAKRMKKNIENVPAETMQALDELLLARQYPRTRAPDRTRRDSLSSRHAQGAAL